MRNPCWTIGLLALLLACHADEEPDTEADAGSLADANSDITPRDDDGCEVEERDYDGRCPDEPGYGCDLCPPDCAEGFVYIRSGCCHYCEASSDATYCFGNDPLDCDVLECPIGYERVEFLGGCCGCRSMDCPPRVDAAGCYDGEAPSWSVESCAGSCSPVGYGVQSRWCPGAADPGCYNRPCDCEEGQWRQCEDSCHPGVYQCGTNACWASRPTGEACMSDEDCVDAACIDGFCHVPLRLRECSANAQCGDGICIDGQCQWTTCTNRTEGLCSSEEPCCEPIAEFRSPAPIARMDRFEVAGNGNPLWLADPLLLESGEAADAVCAERGMRLCSIDDRAFICPDETDYTFGTGWDWSHHLNAPMPTGSNQFSCITALGQLVCDLSGNVAEWATHEGEYVLAGGDYQTVERENLWCAAWHPPEPGELGGVRCCE